MKLSNITKINYDINEEIRDFNAERVVREISEGVAPIVASWYILNESTNRYEINEFLLREGIGEILKKGMGKVNDALTKGYSDLDAIKTKVVNGLKSKGDPGVLAKLGEIAKKNAKYVKPALMVAVVGASLLGMDTASAADAVNQIGSMDSSEFQQYADSMKSQFADYQKTGGGGADAAQAELDAGTSGGQQAQSPQEDQPTEYQDTGTKPTRNDIINNILQRAVKGGADKDAIMTALQSMQIDGQSIMQYAEQMADSGRAVDAVDNIITKLADGDQGGTTTTTTTSGTMYGDGKGGFVDQDGNAAKAPQRYDGATGKWVDSKVTRGR